MARWAPFDAGVALQEAETVCRGIYGPTLRRITDGWEAEATITGGSRRFHETIRSAVLGTPDAALMELADKVRAARA